MLLYLLIIIILFMLYQQSDFISEVREKYASERAESEKTVQEYTRRIEQMEEQLENKNKEISSLKNEKSKLDGAINNYKNRNLPMGEEMSRESLENLFYQFKKDGIINNYKIYSNLLFTDNGQVSQIDHLIVSAYGIFMIETKTWRGDVFYNVSKEYLEENGYAILGRYLFNDQNKIQNNYRTFVIKPDEDLEVQDYGHPFSQVMDTIQHVQPIFKEYVFINGLIYFNYKDNQANYLFEDGTKENSIVRAVHNEEELKAYFSEKFKDKDRLISQQKMEKINDQLKENTTQA